RTFRPILVHPVLFCEFDDRFSQSRLKLRKMRDWQVSSFVLENDASWTDAPCENADGQRMEFHDRTWISDSLTKLPQKNKWILSPATPSPATPQIPLRRLQTLR